MSAAPAGPPLGSRQGDLQPDEVGGQDGGGKDGDAQQVPDVERGQEPTLLTHLTHTQCKN